MLQVDIATLFVHQPLNPSGLVSYHEIPLHFYSLVLHLYW